MLSILSIAYIFFFAVKAIYDTAEEKTFYDKCLTFTSTMMVGAIAYLIVAGIVFFSLYHFDKIME